jgi:hypothetical protein
LRVILKQRALTAPAIFETLSNKKIYLLNEVP